MTHTLLVRALTGVAAVALATALSTTAWAAPKPAATATAAAQYVALGDSYAAGVGAGSYLDGCRRSLKGYPGLIASASGYTLNFQACSGATVNDVLTKQLSTLSADTAKVTVTVGGNDIGFASTLTTCLGTNTTACLNAVTAASTKATTELPASLGALFAAVKTKAPNATIVATAYPRLFNGKDCSILTSFTSAEMTALNNGADTLAGVISTAAGSAGIGYAEVRTPFVKHAVCDSSAWIRNAQLFNQFESFHANSSGYLYGYKPAVATTLGATPASAPTTLKVTTGGKTSSNTERGTVRVKG